MGTSVHPNTILLLLYGKKTCLQCIFSGQYQFRMRQQYDITDDNTQRIAIHTGWTEWFGLKKAYSIAGLTIATPADRSPPLLSHNRVHWLLVAGRKPALAESEVYPPPLATESNVNLDATDPDKQFHRGCSMSHRSFGEYPYRTCPITVTVLSTIATEQP